MADIYIASGELFPFVVVGGVSQMVSTLVEQLSSEARLVVVCIPAYESFENASHSQWMFNNVLSNVTDYCDVALYTHSGLRNVYAGIVMFRETVPVYFTYTDREKAKCFDMCHKYADAFARLVELFTRQQPVSKHIVLTNDWICAFIAQKCKQVRPETVAVHVIHNAHPSYDGALYDIHKEDVSDAQSQIEFAPGCVSTGRKQSLRNVNLTVSALHHCDALFTVSNAYLEYLKLHLHYGRYVRRLEEHGMCFAIVNSGSASPRGGTNNVNAHETARAKLFAKYFNNKNPSPRDMIFTFVGRITHQKGAHVLVNVLIKYAHSISPHWHFIIGGQLHSYANYKDDFSVEYLKRVTTISTLSDLSRRVWISPFTFFDDKETCACGSAFGVIPSNFEPCGIVQQEFFSCGTPVICHDTMGLAETVSDGRSGILYRPNTEEELFRALYRASQTYEDAAAYSAMRSTALRALVTHSSFGLKWNTALSQVHALTSANA